MKLLVALLFIASSEALEVNAASISRRAAIAKVASLASLASPLAAFADLQRAKDGEVYSRADENKLNAARAIERAEAGDLVYGTSATCTELDRLIAIDREAVLIEKDKIEALDEDIASAPAARKSALKGERKTAERAEKRLQSQVDNLKSLRLQKGCIQLKKPTDAPVYKRADEGTLTTSRVIERTKLGELVDGSSATCKELTEIIEIDKMAIRFEKDKVSAIIDRDGSPQWNSVRIINARTNVIDDQVGRLLELQKTKGC